jgi:plasmid stabilization system protein ParE
VRLIWRIDALHELAEAMRAIGRERPSAASKITSAIYGCIGLLVEFPDIGRVLRSEDTRVVRQTTVRGFRIFYAISEDKLEILRVFHVRRDYNPDTIRDAA